MSVLIRVEGEAHLDLTDEILDESLPLVMEKADEAAAMLLAEVQRNLQRRKGPDAAPAGEPPAEHTGELAASYKVIKARSLGDGRVRSGIQSRHPGAARVEFGATDVRGITTKPHPYVRPAEEAMQQPITALLEAAL